MNKLMIVIDLALIICGIWFVAWGFDQWWSDFTVTPPREDSFSGAKLTTMLVYFGIVILSLVEEIQIFRDKMERD